MEFCLRSLAAARHSSPPTRARASSSMSAPARRRSALTASRFLTAYHVVNLGAFVAYAWWSACLAAASLAPDALGSLRTWEKQVGASALAVLGTKFVRRENLDAWLADAFAYGKSAVLVLAYFADETRASVAWTAVAFAILYVYLPHPRHRGATRAIEMTPARFDAEVTKKEWTREDARVRWVVLFRADWSQRSLHLEPTFADLSLTYAEKAAADDDKGDDDERDDVRFAVVDVGRFPSVAERLGIRLDLVGAQSQVPSVVLFERGEERARLPRAYLEGARVKGSRLRRVDLEAGLGLKKGELKKGEGMKKRRDMEKRAKKKD